MSEGFLLGLSTGVVCVAYCGPVLLPYLMAESGGIKKSIIFVLTFLSGRLTAYLLTALLTGLIGQAFIRQSETRTLFMGIAYVLLAALLIIYGFHRFREICLGGKRQFIAKSGSGQATKFLVPFTGGLLTGINICPPFLLAITGALDTGTIAGSIIFFLAFFAGTSIYFIPMPFAGIFRRQQVLRIIGKFTAVLAGFIYLYKGTILILSQSTL